MIRLQHVLLRLALFIAIGGVVMGCKHEQSNTAFGVGPKIVKTNGYVVPKDSISPPKILPREAPITVPAIKNTMVAKSANEQQIDSTRARHTLIPKIATPGENGILLPKVVSAKGKVVMAGLPKVVAAKEVKTANFYLQNFLSDNKLQGYNAFENGNHENPGFNAKGDSISMFYCQYHRTVYRHSFVHKSDIEKAVLVMCNFQFEKI